MTTSHLGAYELQQHLASDPLSDMWKAFDLQHHRYVTIKIFRFDAQIAPHLLPSFLHEAQHLKSLNHPHIASVFDVLALQEPGLPAHEAALVMEYIEGQPLAEYLQATARMGKFLLPDEMVHLLAPLASAIDYAHQQEIIHGAIRPSTILLDEHNALSGLMGSPKLVGFGMNTLQLSLPWQLKDVYYLAPERAQGESGNAHSDIYSLGVILYEMCTGTLPFIGDTPNEVMMQHLHATPPAPALINPHIFPAVTAIILRSLSKDASARFPSASALVMALVKTLDSPMPDILSLLGSQPGLRSSTLSWGQTGSSLTAMNSPTHLIPRYPSSLRTPPSPFVARGDAMSQSLPATPPQPAPIPPLPSITTGPIPVTLSGAIIPPPHQESLSQSMVSSSSEVDAAHLSHVSAVHSPAPHFVIRQSSKKWFVTGLLVLLLAIILGSVGGVFLLNMRHLPIVRGQEMAGHAYFVSSGQLNENTSQGIADRLQIALNNVPAPQPGKSYYIWLLSDNDSQTNISPILLGSSAHGGPIALFYAGSTQHDDLLAHYSRLLVTEEDEGTVPTNPSLDTQNWKYAATFSQVKKPNQMDSLLDHLRHLLSQASMSTDMGMDTGTVMVGGLDIQLFRNTLKVLEEAGSIRDARNGGGTAFMRRQLVRLLDYLDGVQYVKMESLPPDLPPVMVDPIQAHMGLLEVTSMQNPSGYLKEIGNHLRELVAVPGVTPGQKALAIHINAALNNVQFWLQTVHNDATKLIQMTPQQLLAPATIPLLDDLFTQTNTAFVGQTDSNTGQVKAGVVQIHYDIQGLATFDIQPYTGA
jgi:serine/threonine protein kinase